MTPPQIDEETAVSTGAGLDLRLLPSALAAWGAAWAVPALPCRVDALMVALAVLAAGIAAVRAVRGSVAAAVLAAALGLGTAAGLGAAVRVGEVGAGPVTGLAAEQATAIVAARVTGDPATHRVEGRGGPAEIVTVPVRATRIAARGRVTEVRSRVLLVASDPRWRELIPGQKLVISGRLAPGRPRTPTAAILRVRGAPPAASVAPVRDRVAADVRAGLRSAVAGLGSDERALVPGLVLGDTSALDPDLAEDFRAAGLSHVLVVSGSNLALLLGAVLGLGRWAGVRLRALPVLGLVTVVAFVLVARPEPSLLRAAVMGMVGVLGLAAGRNGRAAPALCAAVIALVLVDPWLARSYGFALSVAATTGLITLAPPWRDRLATRMPRPLATALAVPAAAQAACGPIIVLLAGSVSPIAIPANLLAVPAVPAAMFLGVLATVSWPICPPLARLFGDLAGIPAWWIVAVARRAADLPGSNLPWVGGVRGALALALLTLAVVTVRRARPVAVVSLLLAAVLLVRPVVPVPVPWRGTWPPPGWVLMVCDVGQGDALVLRAGPGTAVVVDTGPEPGAVDRCLRRLGIRHIPYLLLTHDHADHVEGLPGALRGRQVAEIGVSPLPDPPGEVDRVARWARAAGVPITVPTPGEERGVGDLRWRVLWPRRLIDEGSPPNNASVVLLVEVAGFRLLLTGDIEPAAQAALLRAEPGLRADFLKVPHHGSAHQDPALLTSLGARLAVASVGAGNDYGHPAPSTLRLLLGAGMRVLRTDLNGDVAVVVREGRLGVAVRRSLVGPQ